MRRWTRKKCRKNLKRRFIGSAVTKPEQATQRAARSRRLDVVRRWIKAPGRHLKCIDKSKRRARSHRRSESGPSLAPNSCRRANVESGRHLKIIGRSRLDASSRHCRSGSGPAPLTTPRKESNDEHATQRELVSRSSRRARSHRNKNMQVGRPSTASGSRGLPDYQTEAGSSAENFFHVTIGSIVVYAEEEPAELSNKAGNLAKKTDATQMRPASQEQRGIFSTFYVWGE